MKTITFSANTSWYLSNFRGSTIRRFVTDGYRVVCISPDDGYGQKLQSDFGCEWLPLSMDNKGSNPLKDILLAVRFWQFYRKLKPIAAFHFTIKNNIYGTWAAKWAGVPAINNVSGLGTAFIRKGWLAGVVRMLYKLSMPLAYRVYCQNEEDYQLLLDTKLVPSERLHLLPGSGVSLSQFKPELRIAHSGNFRFLYAGRMLADKGVYELITAVSEINALGVRCELWMSGFADVKNVSAIDERQLQSWGCLMAIEWLGATDDMAKVYAQVDCVVLPSYREGMPRSLLEAGAMGLPVIASDVPGCRNIIKDGFNGLLCEVKDSRSLQTAMIKMMQLPEAQRHKFGENGRRRVVQKFSEEVVIDEAVSAVNQIIS